MKIEQLHKSFIGLILLVVLGGLVLAACGDEAKPTDIPTFPVSTRTSSPINQGVTTVTGSVVPRVGADGQITVVAPPANLSNFSGSFYYVKNYNIWHAGTNISGITPPTTSKLNGLQITKAENLSIAVSPALSPDGKTLAYAYSPPPQADSAGRITIGQDIVGYDLTTKETKVLIARPVPTAFLDDPVWSADGKYIYAGLRSSVYDKSGAVVGQKYSIQRMELASGQIETLAEDGKAPAPTPDGKFVVFVGVAASTQTFDISFKILDIATRQVKDLVKPDQNFLDYYFPRVSPDGQWIAFAAAGGPDISFNSGTNPTPTPVSGSVQGFGAHGIPYDLWLVKPDGSGLRRLTTLFEDQPMTSWSKDSKTITFLAGQGLYTVDVTNGKLSKKSDEGSHQGFDFRE